METKESINAWRPDWRKPDGAGYDHLYKKNKKGVRIFITSAEQWTWEFLRRSEAYQRDYTAWINGTLFHGIKTKLHSDGRTLIQLAGSGGVRWVDCVAYFSIKYALGHLVKVNSIGSPPIYEKLLVLPPPSATQAPEGFGFIDELKLWRTGDYEGYLAPNEVAVVFDLSRPIKVQLDLVRDILTTCSGNYYKASSSYAGSRRQFNSYFDYLRLLDARYSNTSYSDIADVFFKGADNGEEKAKEKHVQAKVLADGDCLRQILSLSHSLLCRYSLIREPVIRKKDGLPESMPHIFTTLKELATSEISPPT